MASERVPAGKLSAVYRLNGVTVRYRARRATRETTALDTLSLQVDRGDLMVVVGHSGSGKSTLLQVMAGLCVPDPGEVFFRPQSDGHDAEELAFHKLKEDARAVARRRHIGYIYQSFQLVETMTATENVALPLLFGGTNRKQRESRAVEMLDRLGLANHREKSPYQLSGGEQQRVAVARALVTKPAVVLADEPTGSLDTKSAALVLEALSTMHASGALTMVIVTHDTDIARRIGTRTIELCDGAVLRREKSS